MIAKNSDMPLGEVERYEPPAFPDEQAATGRKQAPLIQVLWRRRWTVLLAMLLCVAAAAVYLLKATPIYTSSSRIYVDQLGPKLLTADSQQGLVQNDSYLYTQAQVLSSTPILSNALQAISPHAMKTFEGVDNPLIFLGKEMKVDVGKKDDLITVSMDSAQPQEAAQIVNAVVDAYMTFSSGVKRNSAAEVLKVLARERDKSEEELSAKLQEMMKFKEENGALSFQSEKGNIILERLATLQESLTTCELEEAEAKAEYEVGQEMLKDPVAIRQYVDAEQSKGAQSVDPEYAELRSELRKYQMNEAEVSVTNGAQSRLAKELASGKVAVQAELAERERRFAEAHLAELDQHLQAVKSKEATVREAFDAQQKQALDLNAKATQFAQLEADQNRIEKTCDLLDARIKETNVTEDGGAMNIQVLEVARPGEKPTSPRRALALAVSLLVGMMTGTGAALTREWMDRKLRTPDEVVSALGLPVLGVIPHMRGRQSQVLRGQNVHLDSMSDVAEAYRTIRTAVQFGTRRAENVKTLLVTSPSSGDGKSTSASNLAIAFAQAGYRTLLLDCDLRKPTQHKIFEVEGKTGLTNVVAGQLKLAPAIVKTDVPRLSVLPCGPTPSNPSEMLNGKRFDRVMAALVTAFDKIVIDSPPVMPVTDARVLAAAADVTLLVVRADKTTDRQAAFALDGLRSVGAVMLGVLMNDMARRKDTYGYYSGYYYGTYGRQSRSSPQFLTDVTADVESMGDISAGLIGTADSKD